MNSQIETFIEFLLDTETTSEVSFSQAILEKDELYVKRYQTSLEKVVNQKLQQWKDFYEKEQHAIADRIAINADNEVSDSQSESESEQEFSSEEEEEGEEEEKKTLQKSTIHQKEQKHQPIKQSNIYIDPIGQCKRLLQFLYHCQQDHLHLVDLYFHTLDHCVKNENEKISAIGLQQIALHLSEDVRDQKEHQRLIKYLPSNLTSLIPELHKPILSTIQTLLSPNKTKEDTTEIILSDNLDILYPCTARFLDLRREFRDSTHYFIDGDSLILSVAHHINIDLISYHGNTLHMIFIIERILLTLFNQTQQCNYTLIFFDCHHQCYQQEESILNLLRACLIAHLSKNTNQYRSSKVQQFSSWLDHEYIKFTREEKPHFIFYHDMSSFNRNQDRILSKNALNKLRSIYRLFGNYHQYDIQTHLYLMNKLTLTDTVIQCFSVKFSRKCPKKLLENVVRMLPNYQKYPKIKENDSIEFEKEINQNDIRLFLYLKTITHLPEEDLFKLLSPLLILHVALLIRLSLIDRHLPSDFPSMKYSPIFSKIIVQFQQYLALCLSSYSSSLSWTKIVDLFDGRLFAFTLHQLSSKIYFDSDTMDIVQQCLILLKLPNHENLFHDIIKRLIRLKHITFSSSIKTKSMIVTQKKMTRILNPFIGTLLKPILSVNNNLTFDFVNPEDSRDSTRYKGKYHWHVYKEVGDEISRIRDNDQENRNSIRYRYRTRKQQKFYTYFTLYGRSLTSRDVKDNQLQIVLPTTSTPKPTTGSDAASNTNKKSKNKNPTKKAEKIKEENKQRKLEKRTIDENDQISHVEDLFKQIPFDDYSKLIDTIDECLSSFKNLN